MANRHCKFCIAGGTVPPPLAAGERVTGFAVRTTDTALFF